MFCSSHLDLELFITFVQVCSWLARKINWLILVVTTPSTGSITYFKPFINKLENGYWLQYCSTFLLLIKTCEAYIYERSEQNSIFLCKIQGLIDKLQSIHKVYYFVIQKFAPPLPQVYFVKKFTFRKTYFFCSWQNRLGASLAKKGFDARRIESASYSL